MQSSHHSSWWQKIGQDNSQYNNSWKNGLYIMMSIFTLSDLYDKVADNIILLGEKERPV
jgi:hypothetical protein